ncbi:MAG: replicative DNA helicase [Coriobacteriia bacterium]
MADTRRGDREPRPVSPAERVPPHNFEAEQALLGSMFLSREAVENCIDKVGPEDFYYARHAKIFKAIRHLYDHGEPIDQVSVADRLEASGELEEVGGKSELLTITNVVPTAANALHYAEIVRRTATLRDLITAGTRIAALGYESSDEPDVIVEQAEKILFDVTNRRISEDFKDLMSLLKTSFEHINTLYESKGGLTGVATGFPDLDRILGGLHASDLIVLAARPSVGKTAFALNLAVNAARSGVPVAIFSLEMSSEQLVQRMLCSEGQVDSGKLRSGHLSESDSARLLDAMGRLADLPIHVDDSPAASVLEVRAKARRLFRNAGTGLIIVDYLQLMQPQTRRAESRQVEIADISRGLKVLAKELDMPVVALSQLSRKVEDRPDRRPILSDLRESGAIEQDADVVMFIHRNTDPKAPVDVPDWDLYRDAKPNEQPRDKTEVIVAKHRNGPTGLALLKFHEKWALFRSHASRAN